MKSTLLKNGVITFGFLMPLLALGGCDFFEGTSPPEVRLSKPAYSSVPDTAQIGSVLYVQAEIEDHKRGIASYRIEFYHPEIRPEARLYDFTVKLPATPKRITIDTLLVLPDTLSPSAKVGAYFFGISAHNGVKGEGRRVSVYLVE